MARDDEKNKAKGISSSTVSSALSSAAILPLAVGAGIAAHNIYKTKSRSVGDLFGNTSASSVSEVQDLIRHLKGGSDQMSFRDLGERIKAAAGSGPIATENLMAAWENALRAVTNEQLVSNLRSEMAAISPLTKKPEEILDFIAQRFHGGSIQTRRAGLRFMEGVSAIQKGLKSNQPLISLPTMKPPAATNIGMEAFRTQYSSLAKSVGMIEKELGATVKRVGFIERSGLAGQMLSVEFAAKKGAEFTLNVPMTIPGTGMVATGVGQQTQNIVGAFGVFEQNKIISTMKYEDWAMLRATEGLLPKIKSAMKGVAAPWDIERLVGEWESEIRQPLEYTPQLFGESVPIAHDLVRRYGASALHLVSPSGKLLETSEIDELLRSGQMAFPNVAHPITGDPITLYPWSPNRLRHATFMTQDPAMFRAFPELASYGRRPGQALRGFGPTPTAVQLMTKDPLTRRYQDLLGEGFAGDPFRAPAGRAIYTSSSQAALEEGMFLVSRTMQGKLGVETLTDITIRAGEGATANPILADLFDLEATRQTGIAKLKPGVSGLIPAGTFLGFSPEGEEIVTRANMRVTGGAAFHNMFKISAIETPRLGQFSKYFGDVKGVGEVVDPSRIRSMVPDVNTAAEFLMHTDTLKKNRDLHMKQMFTALMEFNLDNMANSIGPTPHADAAIEVARQRFQRDPMAFWSELRSGFATGEIPDVASGIRTVATRARELGVSPQQAGLIFGAVPAVTGAERKDLLGMGLTEEWIPEVMKGRALGVAHIFSAGPKELTGAGISRASIEPRVFELIRGGQFGDMEEKIFQDIATRRLMTNPELMVAREEFERGLKSISPDVGAGRPIAPSGARVRDIAKMSLEELDPRSERFIGTTGGYVNLGGLGGLQQVYIPSGQSLRQMAAYRTAEEQVIQTNLTRGYVNFLESARAAARGGSQEEFLAQRDELANLLIREHRATVTGEGGIARGGLVGSRFFTGVAPVTADTAADIYRIGVSQTYFEQMFEEMKQAAALRADVDQQAYMAQLDRMRQQFLAGEEVGGYLTRHPFIGKYSIMPVRYRLDKELSDAVVKIPTVKKTVVINGRPEKFNWSVVVGQAGDFDADIYGAILADPRHEADIRNMARMGTPFTRSYEGFAMRHQLMKLRSAPEDIVDPMRAQADEAMKMAVSGRIGEISFEMSKARAALIKQGLTERTSDALFLLEWLEQNPISGKHLRSEQVNLLNPMITDIVTSVRTGNVRNLKNILNQMIDPKKLAELSQDISAEIGGEQVRVPGLNLDQTLDTLQSALEGFREEEEMLSPLRRFSMTRAKAAKFTVTDVLDYLGAYRGTVFEPMVNRVDRGMMATLSKRAMTAMGGLAKGVMENARPIGIGLGASLALAAAISYPRSSLSPGGAPLFHAPMGNNIGDSVNRDNIHPNTQVHGQPSPPRMASGTAPIEMSNPTMSAHIRARARVRGQFDSSSMGPGMRSALGPGTSVNTRVSDDRSVLTAHKLNDILSR